MTYEEMLYTVIRAIDIPVEISHVTTVHRGIDGGAFIEYNGEAIGGPIFGVEANIIIYIKINEIDATATTKMIYTENIDGLAEFKPIESPLDYKDVVSYINKWLVDNVETIKKYLREPKFCYKQTGSEDDFWEF